MAGGRGRFKCYAPAILGHARRCRAPQGLRIGCVGLPWAAVAPSTAIFYWKFTLILTGGGSIFIGWVKVGVVVSIKSTINSTFAVRSHHQVWAPLPLLLLLGCCCVRRASEGLPGSSRSGAFGVWQWRPRGAAKHAGTRRVGGRVCRGHHPASIESTNHTHTRKKTTREPSPKNPQEK